MSYFEAPSSYLERVAELKGKRKNWEKNLLDKVSQELRKDVTFVKCSFRLLNILIVKGYYDFNRKIEQPEINLVPLPKRRKLNVEQFESMSPKGDLSFPFGKKPFTNVRRGTLGGKH